MTILSLLAFSAFLTVLTPMALFRDRQECPLSEEAKQLLAVAENPEKSLADRIVAVRKLGTLKERETAVRLGRLLPGKYDALTLEVIEVLTLLKNPKVLPELNRMLSEMDIEVPGKIRAALKVAIEACRDSFLSALNPLGL